MRKEAILTLRYYPGIYLEGELKKTTKTLRIVGVTIGIRTAHLPDTRRLTAWANLIDLRIPIVDQS
jgi:hypothetical protein